MKPYTTSALALLFALGIATSAADARAQATGEQSPEAAAAEEIAPGTGAEGGGTSEEAGARVERSFEEITGGLEYMTPEQFGAEAGTEDPEGMIAEIDRNGDGQIDREEWMEWQTRRLTEETGQQPTAGAATEGGAESGQAAPPQGGQSQ